MFVDNNKKSVLVKDANEITIGPLNLTKYERARVIAARAMQLAMGAPPLIDVSKLEFKDPVIIAEYELEAGILPILIKRELPSGRYQLIPLKVLVNAEKKRKEYVKNLMVQIFGL